MKMTDAQVNYHFLRIILRERVGAWKNSPSDAACKSLPLYPIPTQTRRASGVYIVQNTMAKGGGEMVPGKKMKMRQWGTK